MRIVVVEDIEQQAKWLCDKLAEKYKSAKLEPFRTESEFREALKDLQANPPDLFIVDMMMRWCDPMPEAQMPPRPNEADDDGRRAGKRCVELLRSDESTAGVPVIIRTVLEDIDFMEGELPPNVKLVTKENDDQPLWEAVAEALSAPA